MPLLPVPECGGTWEAPAACDALFQDGQSILDAAWAGLSQFAPDPGSPCWPGVDRYVSLSEPPADRCDLLAVWLVRYGEVAPISPQGSRRQIDNIPVFLAEWQVDLWEGGYPGPQVIEDETYLPSPDDLHAANQHLYAHGLAMFDALRAGLRQASCDEVRFGELLPKGPSGGCAGWGVRVSMVYA